MRRRLIPWAAIALLAAGTPAASAQRPSPPLPSRDSVHTDVDAPSPSSPRASLTAFQQLTGRGRYAEAAAYLDLPDSLRPHGADLARELRAVLDRRADIEPEDVSGDAHGDTTDALPPGVDQVASIKDKKGTPHAVRMVRTLTPDGVRWRFSHSTVERIGGWYDSLEDRWVFEHLPNALLRPAPLGLLRWQWLGLPLLLLIALALGWLESSLLRAFSWRVARRTSSTWDNEVLLRISAPLTMACALVTARLLLPWLGLYRQAERGMLTLLGAGGSFALFWALWRLVDVTATMMHRSGWGVASATTRALIPMAARVAKIILVAIGIATMLSVFGYPVASVVTGLGLGGLAFALAAQKTIENLFGAFTIGVDKPFMIGDSVKIDDITGTVEVIGLRSTRVRTPDRTLVTFPNGRLADMRIESFTARDRMRLLTVVSLVYETSAAQMRTVLAELERLLREHPKVWQETKVVRFRGFSPSALEIEMTLWFLTTEWVEYQTLRQELMLRVMEIVEGAGTAFAYPTQTVHLAPSAPPPFVRTELEGDAEAR